VSRDAAILKVTDLALPFRETHDLDGLVVAFPDRHGGVSDPPFDSLNLGFSTGDEPHSVRENRRRLVQSVGVDPSRVIVPGQVHGCQVLHAEETLAGAGFDQPGQIPGGHDVVVLPEPGLFALSLTADCPLVVIVDPDQRRAGVAHCGWRGTVAGALDELLREMGPAESLLAMVSPGIRGPRYPVGPEVLEAVAPLPGAPEACSAGTLDLATILLKTLQQAGLGSSRISLDPRCSHADPALFSHRRDQGHSGRGGCLVGWKF
jgi:copper oxidase (laccase) domain-containing protein